MTDDGGGSGGSAGAQSDCRIAPTLMRHNDGGAAAHLLMGAAHEYKWLYKCDCEERGVVPALRRCRVLRLPKVVFFVFFCLRVHLTTSSSSSTVGYVQWFI